MERIVVKFGGTSVADIDRIKDAALRIKAEADAGTEVVAVVSAMAGVTNQMVALTDQMGALFDARGTAAGAGKSIAESIAARRGGKTAPPHPIGSHVIVSST